MSRSFKRSKHLSTLLAYSVEISKGNVEDDDMRDKGNGGKTLSNGPSQAGVRNDWFLCNPQLLQSSSSVRSAPLSFVHGFQ